MLMSFSGEFEKDVSSHRASTVLAAKNHPLRRARSAYRIYHFQRELQQAMGESRSSVLRIDTRQLRKLYASYAVTSKRQVTPIFSCSLSLASRFNSSARSQVFPVPRDYYLDLENTG